MADRAEIAKRIERAEKFLQKGKPDAALEEYLGVLLEDPENDSVRQMAADLSLSVGRTSEAVSLLGQLFERQVAIGDASRASLTFKKLTRYSNPTTDQKLRFGQLLESTNRKFALETYEAALFELAAQGNKKEQMNVLKRIVALEPAMQNFMRMGELAGELGDGAGAAAAFLRVAELMEQAGGAAAPWYEKAYQADATAPRVAVAYARSLLGQGEAGAAIFVLGPILQAGSPTNELRDLYAKALLAANRFAEAEEHVWFLFEQNPGRVQQVASLIGSMLDNELDLNAVSLTRKLEQYQRRRGERRAFLAMVQDIVERHRAAPEMLELLAELYNAASRETDYSHTLLRLYHLYYQAGNFAKAAECFDRAAEVDPYEPGHQKRLEELRGKIDQNRFNVIASRFAPAAKPIKEAAKSSETMNGVSLQDLMLQAEILVQYGMNAKALERLEKIHQLFPDEVESNQQLKQLFVSVGALPPVTKGAAEVPAPEKETPPPVVAAGLLSPPAAPAAPDLSQLTRMADLTRKLHRQSDFDGVLATASLEVGTSWKTTRCVAAMRKPGHQPTAIQEFYASGTKAAESSSLARLVVVADDLAQKKQAIAVDDAFSAPELQAINGIVKELNFTSMLALPLSDGQAHVGVILLLQDAPREWNMNDVVVLKAIAEQIGLALNNAGLRRLVNNLSVTDEKSGLLSRSSYLDLLIGEVRRAQEENSPITLMLLQFGGPEFLKVHGQDVVESLMQHAGKLLASNIRQDDFAFRYEPATMALVLGATAEKHAELAVEKFRRLLQEVKMPDDSDPVPFNAGIAEAVMRAQYDPIDIVTEVINRVEHALEQANTHGGNRVLVLSSMFSSAAVA